MELRILILSILLISSGNLAATTLNEIGESYLKKLVSTMHGESTVSDVEQLTALYSDDIVYEHPKFKMKLEGRDIVKSGIMKFLAGYGGTKGSAKITLNKQILDENVIILEFDISFMTKEGKMVERSQIQVLDIDSGKINRIIDYW